MWHSDRDNLLQKSSAFGFSKALLSLIASYLCHTRQVVCYKKVFFLAWSGVPQGSNLGPLLFLNFRKLDYTDK